MKSHREENVSPKLIRSIRAVPKTLKIWSPTAQNRNLRDDCEWRGKERACTVPVTLRSADDYHSDREPRTELTSLRLRSKRGLESWVAVAVAGQRSQGRAGIEVDRNGGRIQDCGRWNGGRLTQGLRVEAELKEEGLLNTDYRKPRTIEGGNFKIRDMLPEYIHMHAAESVLFAGKAVRAHHFGFKILYLICKCPKSEANKVEAMLRHLKESSEFHKRSFECAVDSIEAIAACHLWQVDVVESQWNVLHGRIQDSYDFTELVLFRQEYLLALISESFLDISFVSRILDSRMKLCPQFYWNIENQETSQTHLNWRTLQRQLQEISMLLDLGLHSLSSIHNITEIRTMTSTIML
ncbi:hypothetical protein CDL15_Pgr010090 [Punica granatum]|uniref:Gamma-tubulin complex component n=1 Tax=Punica granatum TaxID=22663 RepID=A0A218X6V5_PUNGR|nr:hypothetical protein CDL15_Pgr010090 [Punica granatum]